jgi:dipeptidyl aminopeptidase/acylaminoacyl peptidase
MRYAACLLCLLALPVAADLGTTFTVDDMLDVTTVSIAAVKLPHGKTVADNSELRWSTDGDRLYLNLRPEAWRADAARRFRQETQGPIVVHSSTEPFLAWDDVRRLSMERSLADCDLRKGQCAEVLPNGRMGTYELTEDGGAITFSEDITKKTDYDTIHGTEYQVRLIPSAGGEPKEKKAKERFTAVRLSPDGNRLVASNKEGLWMVDTAAGTRELFVKMPEEDKLAPRYQVVDWSPDGKSLYLSYSSRTKWERGPRHAGQHCRRGPRLHKADPGVVRRTSQEVGYNCYGVTECWCSVQRITGAFEAMGTAA